MTLPASPDAPSTLTALGYDSGPWPALLAAIDPTARHGRVTRADRGAATVATADGSVRATWTPTTDPPVTGDWVAVDDDGALVGIAERRTAITRPAKHVGYRTDGTPDQVLAANPDLVGVVVAIDGDDLPVRRVERGIVMAYESGAIPLVIATKADLCEDLDLTVRQLEAATTGVDVLVVSGTTGDGIAELADRLAPDRTLAVLGASGAGKSTLTNALVGHDALAVGHVRHGDRKGRHTTAHRELVTLPIGGAVLDTPGLRTLSLGQVADGIDRAFPEVEALAAACRFGDCRHESEPGCAVLAALDDGGLDADRFEGFRRIRAEAENAALRADTAAWRAQARSWGVIGREATRGGARSAAAARGARRGARQPAAAAGARRAARQRAAGPRAR
uniref:ribosome small subunit-dependent GTPase A n=1 Tax=Euzebya sp. TaxID=1971409 RepID=UPI0035110AC6